MESLIVFLGRHPIIYMLLLTAIAGKLVFDVLHPINNAKERHGSFSGMPIRDLIKIIISIIGLIVVLFVAYVTFYKAPKLLGF